jgi:hypothetical protein
LTCGDCPTKRDVVALETLFLDRLLEHRLELAELAGLHQEIVGTLLHCPRRLFDRAIGGEQDDLGGGRALLDFGQQIQPIAVGQAHVEHDDVEVLPLQQAPGLPQRARRLHRVAGVRQFLADALAKEVLVVHQQQADVSHRHLPGPAPAAR